MDPLTLAVMTLPITHGFWSNDSRTATKQNCWHVFRQSMMVGMFTKQSIFFIDGKIRLFLWKDQIIPIIDGIDGKTGT
jgi:hypothetical protein